MNINLVSSLHLNHTSMSPASNAGDRVLMQSFVPIGLLSLKAAADQAGLGTAIRVTEINGLVNRGIIINDDQFYSRATDAILAADDDMIGFMTDADSLHHTILLAQTVKHCSPSTLICLGGPAASPIGRELIDAFPCIDFVVKGEGERTFVELLSSLGTGRDHAGIRGLTWRSKDRAVENEEREVVENLDDLPFPFVEAYDMPPDAALYLDVGRGCPFNCSFCGTAPFWKRRYRMKSIDRILSEMTYVRDRHGRHHFNFSHDIFTCDRRWTSHFCDRLIAADLDMTWTCSTRTDIVDKDLLIRMAAAGCVEIYYGIESGSHAGQSAINKKLDLAKSRKVVRSTAASGIRPITGFIVGYPHETAESMNATLSTFFDFLNAGGFRAHIFPLCPYHDAPLFRDIPVSALTPAECYDLPLMPREATKADTLRNQHRRIFASTHRYVSPEIPSRLIAACEELSAKLVLLKSIWPRLLPHYASPLDWYSRWATWIEAYNRHVRPTTHWPHQCDIGDLTEFIRQEIVRLDLIDSELDELVRYEQLKLDACVLEASPIEANSAAQPLNGDATLVRRRDYVSASFNRNIRSLVTRGPPTEPGDRHWVICFKREDGDLSTIELPALAMAVLAIAEEPTSVCDLITDLGADATGGSDGGFGTNDVIALLQQLMAHGLIGEATP